LNVVTLLIIVLILIALGALPQAGWHNLGYGLSGGAGLIVLILVILLVLGRV
jgi:Protein of unknown function (DUF3309)